MNKKNELENALTQIWHKFVICLQTGVMLHICHPTMTYFHLRHQKVTFKTWDVMIKIQSLKKVLYVILFQQCLFFYKTFYLTFCNNFEQSFALFTKKIHTEIVINFYLMNWVLFKESFSLPFISFKNKKLLIF